MHHEVREGVTSLKVHQSNSSLVQRKNLMYKHNPKPGLIVLTRSKKI